MMRGVYPILKREFAGYFLTPVAYVFIAVFLLLSGSFTFYLSDFFGRGKADLEPFFMWHPWLYLFLIPAISMRLWAEERRTGTMELLMTLPVSPWQLVAGKFLAAWLFVGVTMLGTLPLWITVNYLGQPDNGVILAGYVGSLLMAGAYLAIGATVSALTRNQVIAFVVSVCVCLAFTVAGFPMVIAFFKGWMPQTIIEMIGLFSFLSNFEDITKGVLGWRSLVYFVSLIGLGLFVNTVVVEMKK